MDTNSKKISKINALSEITVPVVSFNKDNEQLPKKKTKKTLSYTLGLENNKMLKKWNKLNKRIIFKRQENGVQKFSYLKLFILVFLALPIISTLIKVIKVELYGIGFNANIVVCRASSISSSDKITSSNSSFTVPVKKNFKNNIFLDLNAIGTPGLPRLASEKSYCNDLDSLVFLLIGSFVGSICLLLYLSSIIISFGSSWRSFKDFLKGHAAIFLNFLLPLLVVAFVFYFYYVRLPLIIGFPVIF